MVRKILSVIAGFAVWMAVATVFNLPLRLLWRSYASVETTMHFSFGMMTARLLIGFAATILAGLVVARLSRRDRHTIWAFGLLLLAMFAAEHYALGNRLPLWYHLVWLASIVPMTWVGARWAGAR